MHFLAKSLPLEFKLIAEVVDEHPKSSEILRRYFGQDCLRRPGFKIQTIGMACILSGVDLKRLLQEFEKIQN